jgi:exonuclease 3'-5' domain-containing protein 1
MVSGLSKSIETYLSPPDTWKQTKNQGVALFAPEKGGSYEIFERRPLDPIIIAYCSQDVTLLEPLKNEMLAMMVQGGANWENRILAESRKRVALAKDPNYDGRRNRAHALAPTKW